MDSRARLIVSGRVQGVFYRASTAEKARALGLRGFVRNMPDGGVDAVIEGGRPMIERLISWCRMGPPGAQVEEVQVTWEDSRNEFSAFSVR